jgi:hypothetical protein
MPTKKRRESEKYDMAGYTYFPLDVVDWLTSDDVMGMTSSEEGLYIRLLCIQWRDISLPSDPKILEKSTGRDRDLLRRWLAKYQHLFPIVPGNPGKMRNVKLHEIAVEIGKLTLAEGGEEKREEEKRLDLEERETELPLTEKRKTTPPVLSSERQQQPQQPVSPSAPPKACGCPDGLCDWAEEIPGCNVYPGSIGDAIYYQRHVKKNDYFIPKLTRGYVLSQWQRILNDTPEDFEYEAVPLFKEQVSHLEGGATHTSKVVQRRPKNAKERALLQQNISSNRQWLYDPACPNHCKEGYLDVSDYPDDPLFSKLTSTVICECVGKGE